jgi:hypothetical protein
MSLFGDLIETVPPILTRAAEAFGIMQVKLDIATKELTSYIETDDVADLISVERILEEMKTEIAHAQKSVSIEINRESEKISATLAKGDMERPS